MRLSPLRLPLSRQLRETFGYSVVKDRRIDCIRTRQEQIGPPLPPSIEVRLSAGRPAEDLMRSRALERLPAIPAQNAFCAAIDH
jgi:hypothetical protein